MTKISHVAATEDTARIIDILKKDGCIVIDNVLTDEELSQLQSDLSKQFDQTADCQGDFYGYATKRMSSLFTKSKICQKMAVEEKILAVMDAFLLKGCSQYQINLTQAISIGPSEIQQIIHQDDPMFSFLHPESEKMINCMWAVDDFTEENGATVLVPGSHLWTRSKPIDPDMRMPLPEEMVQGTMKAGSVLIYMGSLFHSGGENKTNQRRCGAVISYCLGWLRQAENQYLAYTKEEVKDMPKTLQTLLGYFVHKPNLGSVEGMDPATFLDKSEGRQVFTEFMPEEVKPLLKQYREEKIKAA